MSGHRAPRPHPVLWAVVVVAALALGGIVGLATPAIGPTAPANLATSPVASPTPGGRTATPAEIAHARTALPTLRQAGDVLTGKGSGYDRDARFGGWDPRGRGCDVRDAVLAAELTRVTYRAGSSCDVTAGLLDGAPVTSSDVDIDHVVPLRLAWSTGAAGWDDARRHRLANDRDNLRVERGHTNRSDGAQGPEASSPADDRAGRCRYGVRYVIVAERYGLTVTRARAAALAELVGECPL